MAVTINTLGTRSRQIVISGETTATNIIAGINTALTALGWTLHDTVTSGSKGLLTTKVYSAACVDTLTTKYMILRFDLPKGLWYVSGAENWNNTTHVATNEIAISKTRQFPMPLQYSNCTIWVFATARYAAFQGAINNEFGMWQGIFEFEREAAEDTGAGGVPCFGWTSSLTIGEPYAITGTAASSNTYGSAPVVFAVPRTKTGLTGASAGRVFVINTAIGMYPPSTDALSTQVYSSGGLNVQPDYAQLGAFGTTTSTYAWDSGKKIVSNLKLAGYNSIYPTGKIYGLKVVPPIGNITDTVTIPVDSDGFYNSSGTNTTNILLGINGGYPDKAIVAANRVINTNYTTTQAAWGGVIVNGNTLYYVTSGLTTIYKLNLVTGLVTTVVATLPAGANADMVWDGANYLYISTTLGLSRLSLDTETLTNLAGPSGGYSILTLDDTYVYAAQSTSSTTPKLDIINQSTYVIDRTYTSPAVTSSRFNALITCDYSGYVYTHAMAQHLSSNNIRLWKIEGSTGNGTTVNNTISTVSGGSASGQTGTSMVWDGTYIHMLWSWYSAPNGYIFGNYFNISDLNVVGSNYTLAQQGTSDPSICLFNNTLLINSYNTPVKGMFMFPSYTGTYMTAFNNTVGINYIGAGQFASFRANIFSAITSQAIYTDGVSAYTSTSSTNLQKAGNLYPNKNNPGNATAQIAVAL